MLGVSACGSDPDTAVVEPEADTTTTVEDDAAEEDDHDDEPDDDESGLGAHEHGIAEMSVAWIGTEVAIDLISPTINVFGFEYEAECALTSPATTELEYEGSHAEITVSWVFECANPDAIEQIDFTALFTEFPGFEDIDAQWLSDADQSAAELTPESPTLQLTS